MPHLRFRAVDSQHIANLSATLPKALAVVMNTSEDNFTFESVATTYYEHGKVVPSYPFVEVFWFARPQDVQDRSANLITEALRRLTQAVDIVVVFQVAEASAYYENGKHF